MKATRLDTPEVAKLIRKDLRATWPTITFRVRSSRYSGGSSIDVSWTDGPTTNQVDQLVNHYAGADFDGMTDMKEYRPDELVATGPDTYELRDYGVDFVQCQRSEGAAILRKTVAEVAEYVGLEELPTVIEGDYGAYIDPSMHAQRFEVSAHGRRGELGALLAIDTHGSNHSAGYFTELVRTLWSYRDYSVRCEHETGTYGIGNGTYRCKGCGMRTSRAIPEPN